VDFNRTDGLTSSDTGDLKIGALRVIENCGFNQPKTAEFDYRDTEDTKPFLCVLWGQISGYKIVFSEPTLVVTSLG
jgi:hypothetical protein